MEPNPKSGDSQKVAGSSQWKRLTESGNPEEFAKSWLTIQCGYIEGVLSGVVVLGDPETGEYKPAAFWPKEKGGSMGLTSAAESAMEQKKGIVRSRREFSYLAYPFLIDDQLFGVVALEITARKERLLRDAMRMLQWGSSWIELQFRRRTGPKIYTGRDRLGTVLELVAAGLENENFQAAANTVVTDMAVQLDCERVSLGFVKRNNVHVAALSHSAKFSKKSNLIRDIGQVMDESLDQKTTICFPLLEDSTPLVNRVHEELCKEHRDGAVCTVPVSTGKKIFGALTFEKSKGKSFNQTDVDLCETVAQMVGPILHAKRKEDRLIFTKILLSIWQLMVRLFGAHHWGWKLGAALIVGLVVFFNFATMSYRISADTRLEGEVQRVIVAPIEGYIAKSSVRPGDVVKKGDILYELEDKDLVVERLKWRSQIEQYQRKYRDALSKMERSEIRVLKAQLAQAEARLELTQKKLTRTRAHSPFDGIVVSGDLSQSLGAPVERGEVLFQLAPLDEYRVILDVDEKDIAEIRPGQKGLLVLSGVVEENLPFEVKKITPVTEVKEGGNYFRVEARLTVHRDFLRPGMEGVGKIEIEERKLIWILTRDLVNWVRLKVWTWWP